MNREWWVPIVQWSLWGVAMTVVMGWMARSRQRKRPEAERNTLRHPPSTLVIGIIGAAFFFGIAIISNTIGKNASTSIWTTLIFVGFGLASTPMITDYFFARHRVSEQGMEYGRMLGQRGSFRWAEVQRVRFSSTMKWFVVEVASGPKVRVSAMLIGLPEFAHFVLRQVPRHAIEPDTVDILLETEQGRPPSVWG